MAGKKRSTIPLRIVDSISKITKEDVLELLRYDREAGAFFWRIRACNSMREGDRAGGLNANGYRAIRVCGHKCPEHRMVWLVEHGQWPEQEIDHINGDRSDNRISNLRSVSKSQNQQNRKTASSSASGLIGVRKSYGGKWVARISKAGDRRWLGTFDSNGDAFDAYKRAKAELHESQPFVTERMVIGESI